MCSWRQRPECLLHILASLILFWLGMNAKSLYSFVDRDMLMWYEWGMGIGHTYSWKNPVVQHHAPDSNRGFSDAGSLTVPLLMPTQDSSPMASKMWLHLAWMIERMNIWTMKNLTGTFLLSQKKKQVMMKMVLYAKEIDVGLRCLLHDATLLVSHLFNVCICTPLVSYLWCLTSVQHRS